MTVQNKIILLDLGRVVFRFEPQLTFEAFKLNDNVTPYADIHKTVATNDLYLEFEKGLASFDEFKLFFEKLVKKTYSNDEFKRAWNACLPDLLPGVNTLLDDYSKKVNIYALSNTNYIHLEHMKSFEHFSKLKKVFTSCEMKLRKPDPQIFKSVLDELNISDPSSVLYVDDLLENVEAAAKLGISAEQCENSTDKLRSIISNFLA